MSINSLGRKDLSNAYVERRFSCKAFDAAKKLMAIALPMLALASIPTVAAGPVTYGACVALNGGGPWAYPVCAIFLGPWCP
jgi:hypothetical protein